MIWIAFWFAALALDLAWLLSASPGQWQPWAALLLTIAAAGVSARLGWAQAGGELQWDQQFWWWEHDGARTRGWITPELDLQFLLVLRFVSDQGRTHWFWLERGPDRARWLAVKRAAHAHQGHGPDDASRASKWQEIDGLRKP